MGLALKLLAVPRPHNVYAAAPACKDTASWVYVMGGRIMGTLVPPDRQPTFGDATVAAQRYTVGTGVTLTFAVEVGTAGAIRPQEGTTTYTVNGQPVMVTQAPGTMMSIALTVTQPAALDRAVTITVRSPGADIPLARGRYGFGSAETRTVVDLTVAPVPTGGVDVCLPVPAELRTAAGGGAGALRWAVVGTGDRRDGRHRGGAGVPAVPGVDYEVAGAVDDGRIEPAETFTMRVTGGAGAGVELVQATVGGQPLELERTPQRGRRRGVRRGACVGRGSGLTAGRQGRAGSSGRYAARRGAR